MGRASWPVFRLTAGQEACPWSFYIWQGFASIVGQALSPANRALDQSQARGFAVRPALTGWYSPSRMIRSNSTSSRTRWSKDSSCRKDSPVRPRIRFGLSRGGVFQPACDRRQRGLGPHEYVHVIRHDHPGSELIKLPSDLAIQESISHHTRYSGILQPNRSKNSFVHFAVPGEEGPAGGNRRASRQLRQSSRRDGIRQTPSDKQAGCLDDIGMPVGSFLG